MKPNWQMIVVAALLAAPGCYAAQENGENAAPTLPEIGTVLQRVAEQAQKEDDTERAFKQRYSYNRSKVTEYRDGDGEVQKREEKKGANKPKPASLAPLPNSSAEKSKGTATTDVKLNSKAKAFEKSDFAMTDDLLGRFDFSLVGRETIQGRPALVLDFKPAKKDVPERNMKDKFINKAAGRVWVDEADYALVKASLFLTERVNVIGGLVGAVKKFTYSFDRERTADGLWYARNVDWHLEGREVFFHRTIDYHEEKTDVKKVW